MVFFQIKSPLKRGQEMYMFKDRYEAGRQLALKLEKYRGEDAIVLAIPRGGVPVGYAIASELEFPMEVILAKKIGHPVNPEYAIGSVTLQSSEINYSGKDVSADYIKGEEQKILSSLGEKFRLYMGNNTPSDLKNKTVIIVDDGIATGSTVIATVNAVRKKEPKVIVVAVPVSPIDSMQKIKNLVNDFICILTPQDFLGVGQFYYDFMQISDEEVIQLLNK